MPIHGLTLSSSTHPAHFNIESIIRPNILSLHPYRCARDDYNTGVLLDANENALGHSILPSNSLPSSLRETLDLDLHRYPSPSHDTLKSRIAKLRDLPESAVDHIFLGVGSDEVIDLLMRACVAPGKEKILITPPTYGMYKVSAQVNDLDIVTCHLELGSQKRFELRVEEMKKTIDADPTIKLIFLCSPGNPTGTLIPLASIRALLEYPNFKGIVVVDEAYIDFAPPGSSALQLVTEYANICVVQTLSKSFGLAAIRLGIAFAQPPLIQVLNNIKAPYNISTPTAHLAGLALSSPSLTPMQTKIHTLIASRTQLLSSLLSLQQAPFHLGEIIGANHANWVLVRVYDREGNGKPDSPRAEKVHRIMAEEGVVVRYRGGEIGCEGCLRITVGSEVENETLMAKLKEVLERV